MKFVKSVFKVEDLVALGNGDYQFQIATDYRNGGGIRNTPFSILPVRLAILAIAPAPALTYEDLPDHGGFPLAFALGLPDHIHMNNGIHRGGSGLLTMGDYDFVALQTVFDDGRLYVEAYAVEQTVPVNGVTYVQDGDFRLIPPPDNDGGVLDVNVTNGTLPVAITPIHPMVMEQLGTLGGGSSLPPLKPVYNE